jgi:hypothetical protein
VSKEKRNIPPTPTSTPTPTPTHPHTERERERERVDDGEHDCIFAGMDISE